MKFVIFGVSNMIGDIFDCALALDIELSRVVMNQSEMTRPRTKSIEERLSMLAQPPEIIRLDDFVPRQDECYFIGTTSPARKQLVEDVKNRFNIEFYTLVHPTAYVSPLAKLEQGVFVGAGSIIGPGAQLGEQVFVNRKASVGHDTIVGNYSRLQPGSNLGGHITLGENVTVGMGSNIIEELEIGAGSIIAAGSAVIRDVPKKVLMAGVPAIVKKELKA